MPLSNSIEINLIPRRLLFGNASRLSPRLSPDGARLAWGAPVDGVMNIWVASVHDIAGARALTRTSGRPILGHFWSVDGRYVMYFNDLNGDEDDHLFAADAETGEIRDLTPFDKVSATLLCRPRDQPDRVVVGLNDRDAQWHDVWSISLDTGERTLLFENADRFGSFVVDFQGKLRVATRSAPERDGSELFRFENGVMQPWRLIPFVDDLTTGPIAFNRAGTHLSMVSSIGRDTAALIRIDMATDTDTVIAEHPKADLGIYWLLNPSTLEIDAIAAEPIRLEWIVLNPDLKPTVELIRAREPEADFYVESESDDNRFWTVTMSAPDQPSIYYLVDRAELRMTELFRARPDLAPYRLAGMQGFKIKSRDGLDLVSYLSLPPGEAERPSAPLPMVLLVHGGPWSRDSYGYHRIHQWLANRGYAVLSVNYRASYGFGKAFMNAGDREHAGKMHDDLIDGVEWAIAEGIAQRDKVAIMGGSYGGYAAFVGATFTPDVFACAIPIVGITDLVTLMQNRPPYWADFMEHFHRRYADVRTEEGRNWLRARSPLYKADQIKKPMLIGHGANDIRCTVAQSDMIVAAMQAKNLEVTYVVFPDEGHGFYRPENDLAFRAITEAFLARHLGGRLEPIGDNFAGSSHEIRAGGGFLAES